MPPRALRCDGCGGPLPDAPADASSVTCTFCGTVHHLGTAAAAAPAVVVVDLGQKISKYGRRFALGVSIYMALFTLVVALAIYWPGFPFTEAPPTAAREAMAKLPRTMAPSDLAGVVDGGWRPLQVPPPPGGWNTFDAVTELPWMHDIARAWAPDAVLTRIDLTRIAADGTVNLAGDETDTVGYRFVSPARIATWATQAERDTKAEAAYELMVKVARQEVTALVSKGRPSSVDVPPAFQSLPLTDLLPRARESGRFADHPFYNGYLLRLEREGWVWYFQDLSQRESLPRVRAQDAAVYPYRTATRRRPSSSR